MGDFKSLPLISILTVYFFLFLTITVVADDVEMDEYYSGDIISNGTCTAPRIAFDDEFKTYEVNEPSANCIKTRVAYDEQGCNDIPGCAWDNETIFFFFNTGSQICDGSIDKDNLSGGESWGLFTSVCELADVRYNQTLCYNIGCTWASGGESFSKIDNKNQLLTTISDLFTFRYDFGFSGDLETVNIVINFFLFYLPLVLLIGAIYFMIPIIH